MSFLSIDSKLDVKNMFTLSFDFQLLQEVITVLISNQKSMTKRVNAIEAAGRIKDSRITEYSII